VLLLPLLSGVFVVSTFEACLSILRGVTYFGVGFSLFLPTFPFGFYSIFLLSTTRSFSIGVLALSDVGDLALVSTLCFTWLPLFSGKYF
jgi:hypothetical protein